MAKESVGLAQNKRDAAFLGIDGRDRIPREISANVGFVSQIGSNTGPRRGR